MKYPMIDNREIDTDDCPHGPTDNVLILTCGLPRSGKSTWARKQGVPIVCPDAIRLAKTGRRWFGSIEHEVWSASRTMVRALFLAGHSTVVLDSTCDTRKQRDFFIPSPDVPWHRYVKEIHTPPKECKHRASETYPDLIEVIDFMHENWEPIRPEEGLIFDWVGNSEKSLDFPTP